MKLTWPQAILGSAVLVVIAALVFAGKDTSALVTGAIAILGALGFVVKQGAEVKEQGVAVQQQTNGNTRELMSIISKQQEHIQELAHKLADSSPPR